MKHIPSPFKEGDRVVHKVGIAGRVTHVRVCEQSADLIEIRSFLGRHRFLAGSVAQREWEVDPRVPAERPLPYVDDSEAPGC